MLSINIHIFNGLRAFLTAGAALLLFPAAPALAGDDVRQTYELKGFDRIELAGVFEVDVTVGKEYSVVVSGPRDEMERLNVKLKGKTLILDQKEQDDFHFKLKTSGLDVAISLPSLVALDVTGIVDADIEGIDSEELSVDLAGIGDVSLSGECVSLTLQLSGIGDLDAEDLRCRTVEVDVSGLGEATVYAIDAADADVSGMGSIDIYGSPKVVRRDSSFFADITVR